MPLVLFKRQTCLWRAYSKVIGILPWVGTAFVKQQQAVQEGSDNI